MKPASIHLFPGRLFHLLLIVFACIILQGMKASAAELTDIGSFKGKSNNNITLSKNKVSFYGVDIQEGPDTITAKYKNQKLFTAETGFPEPDKKVLRDAKIIEHYPVPGAITMWLPVFNGGGHVRQGGVNFPGACNEICVNLRKGAKAPGGFRADQPL